MNSSGSIIGGADGPTAIFIFGNPMPLVIGAVVVIAAAIGLVIAVKKKNKKH